MSAHTKGHHTNSKQVISIVVTIPGKHEWSFSIPNTEDGKEKLKKVQKILKEEQEITPWDEATPWEDLASDNISLHKEAGIVLRGARLREGISQKELAKRSGISQDNISRMENGKRVIGEKVAKKLAAVLHIDYKLLLV